MIMFILRLGFVNCFPGSCYFLGWIVAVCSSASQPKGSCKEAYNKTFITWTWTFITVSLVHFGMELTQPCWEEKNHLGTPISASNNNVIKQKHDGDGGKEGRKALTRGLCFLGFLKGAAVQSFTITLSVEFDFNFLIGLVSSTVRAALLVSWTQPSTSPQAEPANGLKPQLWWRHLGS